MERVVSNALLNLGAEGAHLSCKDVTKSLKDSGPPGRIAPMNTSGLRARVNKWLSRFGLICRQLSGKILGNISYRLGSVEAFDKKTRAFGDDKNAAECLERLEEHFKDHMLPLDGTNVRVGPKLVFDPKNERFPDDKSANAMLTREYRKGFEVPAKV